MRISLLAVPVLFAALFAAAPAYAWDNTGHRVVGAIAERHLSDQARSGVKDILGSETLAEASTWADEMRSDPDPFWQKEAGTYHYITVPLGKTYADVGAPPQGDAVTALKMFSKTLRDPNATRERKQLALRFIVHIVGDVHLPIHAFSERSRGQRVTIDGETMSLHALWDRGLVDHENLSYSEWTAFLTAKITPEQLKEWANPDPLVWIAESIALRDGIYPEQGVTEISYVYIYKQMPVVKLCLTQAGVRLASYLNAVFAKR